MEECGEALTNEMDLEPYFVDFMREAPEPTGSQTCQSRQWRRVYDSQVYKDKS